jgi:hypothetical protein
MKNIHVLPTDKPSRLSIDNDINELVYGILSIDNIPNCKNQNIYITNNEEIKEGDWCLDIFLQAIFQANSFMGIKTKNPARKIILTTDQDLIKDGIQAIDDEFLEWFVKNPNCESVEVERIFLGNSFVHIGKTPSKKEKLRGCYDNGKQIVGKWEELFTYKIIITQEEPNRTHYLHELPNIDKKILAKMWKDAVPKLEPKQETLEEATERAVNSCFKEQTLFELGAKWQQERSYSEEEIRKSLLDIILINPAHISLLKSGYGQFPDTFELTEKGVDYIIEQFKKK